MNVRLWEVWGLWLCSGVGHIVSASFDYLDDMVAIRSIIFTFSFCLLLTLVAICRRFL